MTAHYLIYKPYQVLSQFSPVRNKQTLADYFSVPADVYPVGRLDYDSEGLLLLSNDTKLNHRLLDPKFAHVREYFVQLDGAITDAAIEALRAGVVISVDGKPYRTRPCQAFIEPSPPPLPDRHPPIRFRKHIPAPWIRLVLGEGKNRQVRKMTAAVGFPTLRLVRYRVEGLTVEGMLPGTMIKISDQILNEKIFHDRN